MRIFLARKSKAQKTMVLGALGFLASILFGASHIFPIFTSSGEIGQETFMVFVLFSLAGFALFTFVIKKDTGGIFGNTSIVWVGLSIMITFFSGAWIIERSKRIHGDVIGQIKDYYASLGGGTPDDSVLEQIDNHADKLNSVWR